MPTFVVAVEYRGADLPSRDDAPRIGLREHAWNVEAGSLVHQGAALRVGFPDPQRGWPQSAQLPRCSDCTTIVSRLVSYVVEELVITSLSAMSGLTAWAGTAASLDRSRAFDAEVIDAGLRYAKLRIDPPRRHP